MDKTILHSIHSDFEKLKPLIKEISSRIIREEISEYPIYIASHEWVDIGKPIVNREEMELNWYFYVSVIEDFSRRKIIPSGNLDEFKRAMGDPEQKACVFTIFNQDANFVFIPFDADISEEEEAEFY